MMKSIYAGGMILLMCSIALTQTKHVVSVPASDGILLDATYYVPTNSPPLKGFPAIIFIHGFAMSKAETDASAQVYARMGYLTFTYSVRGHGNSQGLSTIISWKERNDLKIIIDYVAKLPNVDSKSIGITGGSQGGLHGLWAAADNLPVKAITADVIGPHWASDMLANGCYRTTLMYLLSANTVLFDPVRDTLFNFLLLDDYEGFYNTFVPSRDIDGKAFEAARTPLMLFGKWQDHYFRANEGINAYDVYRAKKDAEKLYLGTGGHYSDDVWSEWNYQFGWITRWFDQFLMANQNGILREPDITYAYSSLPVDTNGYFTWAQRMSADWQSVGTSPLRLYLSANGSLRTSPSSSSNASQMLLNDYRDSTYTFYWAYWDDFQGEWFDSSFRQQTLVFQTQPLTNNVDWVGVPKMHLYVTSDADKFPINAQVYEVDTSGKKYFVNRINYEGRYNDPGTMRIVTVDGNAHAHQFKAGNSIRIELTNLDQTNRKVMGYYPFVVPVFQRSQTWISMDQTYPSYIELPVLPGTFPVTLLSDESLRPVEFQLAQNYPNPFNPRTTIRYTLLQTSYVTLTVFDLLGRNIQTLVERMEQPGERSVLWDAAGLPSGVYMYRLHVQPIGGTRQPFLQVRKMLMLK